METIAPLVFQVKTYSDLSRDELYNVLQLRSEVFVVEQDCVYQDIDGKDKLALHVLGFQKNELVAYTRIFPPNIYFQAASIGRVVVKQKERHQRIGSAIMKASIEALYNNHGKQDIKISAQTYLINFYNTLGFEQKGESYLEDGIPHIAMVLSG